MQEYLYPYNKNVDVTGSLDANTQAALNSFKAERGLQIVESVGEQVYLALFENVPLEISTKVRLKQVNAMIENYQTNLRVLALPNSAVISPVAVILIDQF